MFTFLFRFRTTEMPELKRSRSFPIHFTYEEVVEYLLRNASFQSENSDEKIS